MTNASNPDRADGSDTARIVATPGTCGGKPRIDGHRIRVQDVMIWVERMGMTTEQIVEEHPGLTPAQVEAAIRYFAQHRDEIEAHLRRDEELADELERFPGSLLNRLARKIDAGHPIDSSG